MLNIPEGIRTISAALCGLLVFVFASANAISKIYNYYLADPSAIEQETN